MFDISFSELFVFGTVALLVLGPNKLPGALRAAGQWLAKARRLMTSLQVQSGIAALQSPEYQDQHHSQRASGGASSSLGSGRGPGDVFVPDGREYPVEGPDAYGALPEDLLRLE